MCKLCRDRSAGTFPGRGQSSPLCLNTFLLPALCQHADTGNCCPHKINDRMKYILPARSYSDPIICNRYAETNDFPPQHVVSFSSVCTGAATGAERMYSSLPAIRKASSDLLHQLQQKAVVETSVRTADLAQTQIWVLTPSACGWLNCERLNWFTTTSSVANTSVLQGC